MTAFGEPWKFDPENTGMDFDYGWGIYSEPDPLSILGRPTIAHIPFKVGEETAKRIVSCVNSCAGLNPEAVKELVEVCGKLLEDAKYNLKEQGGCDHSAGVCVCDEIRHIETAESVLAKLQEAK